MRSIYTRFPNRGAGIGLLLLRIAVAATLIFYAGSLSQLPELRFAVVTIGVLAFLSGLALLVGFLTPLVSIVAILILASIGYSWFPPFNGGAIAVTRPSLDVVVIAAAVVLLGPGALSVDAHLFGRRKIIIPPASSSEKA